WKMDTVELKEGTGDRRDEVMKEEGKAILERLDETSLVWALTRKGTGITSRGLASRLESLAVGGHPGLAFVLGGAFGLSPEVLARCDRKLSLSPMTLPHDLARLILLEQLYRAGTIRRNEPYHKGS
ncbi:MAG: 23S rRNA (pseudouridine(1915)-N(3))-methyltransferase RlmH, partial [Longimicrobiales bacterium]|nr:23S rRNA (pseudouridine(1915)-N(3))-methyltransferase RlmH [Longimicrobiales bacterium]